MIPPASQRPEFIAGRLLPRVRRIREEAPSKRVQQRPGQRPGLRSGGKSRRVRAGGLQPCGSATCAAGQPLTQPRGGGGFRQRERRLSRGQDDGKPRAPEVEEVAVRPRLRVQSCGARTCKMKRDCGGGARFSLNPERSTNALAIMRLQVRQNERPPTVLAEEPSVPYGRRGGREGGGERLDMAVRAGGRVYLFEFKVVERAGLGASSSPTRTTNAPASQRHPVQIPLPRLASDSQSPAHS